MSFEFNFNIPKSGMLVSQAKHLASSLHNKMPTFEFISQVWKAPLDKKSWTSEFLLFGAKHEDLF